MAGSTCVFDWRYGSPEVRKIFSVENIVNKYIIVERALLKAMGEVGIIPRECYLELERCVGELKPLEIYEKELSTGHDIASLAFILGERCGECGKYVHLGATSYDIVDTAWALILRDALNVLKSKLKLVIGKLVRMAEEHISTYVVGRTHGQHALPITFGFKFANYAYELSRSFERIVELEKRVIRLKMSGSVGTLAAWGDKGFEVEARLSKELGLEPHIITTQVAPRDGFAELVSTLAILASQLDRLALEIRELSRTEIAEVYEDIERIGSSAMPHKHNPVIAERISGLAKVARSFVMIALENIPLMHERDLTNSSSERFLIPHAVLTIDQMLDDTYKMLSSLKINSERALRNIEMTRGAIYSELLVYKLVEKGWARHTAYHKIRDIVKKLNEESNIIDAVMKDPELSRYFSKEELLEITSPSYATRNIAELVKRTIEYVVTVTSSEY